MDRRDLFVKPVWVEDLDIINNSELSSYAYRLMDSTPERRNTSNYISNPEFKNTLKWRSYYLSKDDITFSRELTKLVSLACDKANECLIDLNPKSNVTLKLNECWFNINGPTDAVPTHVHPGTTLVLTYYVKVPENSGDIVFQNVETSTYWNYPPKYFTERNKYTDVVSYVHAKEGRMVFFPANLMHYVQTNHSSDDRICLTFNFGIKDINTFGPNHKLFKP